MKKEIKLLAYILEMPSLRREMTANLMNNSQTMIYSLDQGKDNQKNKKRVKK
jgi:hypothetical protein